MLGLLFTSLLAVYANSWACTIAFRSQKTSMALRLMGHMAIGDLLWALSIPLRMVTCSTVMLNGTEKLCFLATALRMLGANLSVGTGVLISVDKYGD